MLWLMVVLGYFLGSIPSAYVAGHLLRGKDIRLIGDGNVGAANAFHQLGAKAGIAVGLADAGKGALAILIAQVVNVPQLAVLATGAAGSYWSQLADFYQPQGRARREYYHWGTANLSNPADAHCGWTSSIDPPYQEKCNSGQCLFVCPATAGVLVAGVSWNARDLQYGSALPGRLHPFPQNKTRCTTSNLR